MIRNEQEDQLPKQAKSLELLIDGRLRRRRDSHIHIEKPVPPSDGSESGQSEGKAGLGRAIEHRRSISSRESDSSPRSPSLWLALLGFAFMFSSSALSHRMRMRCSLMMLLHNFPNCLLLYALCIPSRSFSFGATHRTPCMCVHLLLLLSALNLIQPPW